jgi:hypothetical protein
VNRITQYLSALALGLSTTIALATPSSLTTHNLTDVESNAYIEGNIPSPVPSKPNYNNVVPWIVVQMACYGRTIDGKCPATIKMATNTANPIELGQVFLNMANGEITPAEGLSANGYTLTVNGIGEVTLTKDK